MTFVDPSAEVSATVPTPPIPPVPRPPLHRIHEIRQQQNVSLRTCARRMATTMQTVREQELGTTDMLLSELYKWQRALEVPIGDLLEDRDAPLSAPVLQRARMLKMMKTALSLSATSCLVK